MGRIPHAIIFSASDDWKAATIQVCMSALSQTLSIALCYLHALHHGVQLDCSTSFAGVWKSEKDCSKAESRPIAC
eukprot:29148-Amphidinium_carterae.1